MNERIFLSPPDVTDAERSSLLRAFDSGWIAPLGQEVDALEAELAEFCGREHAVALSSGTAGLHLAGLVFGLQPGDVVIVASMTFAATINAITYTGASPVLVDSDEHGSIDVELTRTAIEDQLARGKRVKAIMPVDLLGHVVDHEALQLLADEFGVPVISDAAESLGAIHRGKPAGAWGDAAVISFNGNKVMTTSGGGAFLTNDEQQARRVRYLATQARQPVLHYEHTEIGYNYRLSNLLAGMGRSQLARLPGMLERRRQHRLHYRAFFADVPGVRFFSGDDDGHEYPVGSGHDHDNFWLTSIVIEPEVAGFTRDDVIHALAADNIESRPLWKPMHAQPVCAAMDHYVNGNSDRLFANGVSLPSGSSLQPEQLVRIDDALDQVVRSR